MPAYEEPAGSLARVPDPLPFPKRTQSQEPPRAAVSPLRKGAKYLSR